MDVVISVIMKIKAVTQLLFTVIVFFVLMYSMVNIMGERTKYKSCHCNPNRVDFSTIGSVKELDCSIDDNVMYE